jgi:hypothetical protein
MSRAVRLCAWVLLVGVLLGGQVVWLYALRGPALLAREAVLIWGQVVLAAAALGMLGLLKTTPGDAIRLSGRVSAWVIVGGTVMLQATAVVLLAPLLSDDLSRYRLDGRMWTCGVSPYSTTPEEFAYPLTDPLDAMVPYRDWHTIYPPVSQAVFAGARWLDNAINPPGKKWLSASPGSWRAGVLEPEALRRTRVFRGVFALFAVGAVIVLVRALGKAGQSVWYAAVLGWNPLFTLESGAMGHQDAIGLFFVAAALAAVASRHFNRAGAALALACGVKPLAVLLLPFLWRQTHEEHDFRAGRKMVLLFGATFAVVYIPALLVQNGWVGWRQTVGQFSRSWEANGLFYESFKALFGQGDAGRQMERAKDAARLFAAIAALGMGLLLWQSRARLAEAGYWVMLILLLFAPLVYPWYLLWVLVFIPMLRGPQGFTGLAWTATASMSYTLWRNAPWTWEVPPAWMAAQYLPVLCVLAVEVARLGRGLEAAAPRSRGKTVPDR